MRYTIRKVFYSAKLFHNKEEMRRVKAYGLRNGLFVHRSPMAKTYRISHVNGTVLPPFFKTRQAALTVAEKLQAMDWTDYAAHREALLTFYRDTVK